MCVTRFWVIALATGTVCAKAGESSLQRSVASSEDDGFNLYDLIFGCIDDTTSPWIEVGPNYFCDPGPPEFSRGAMRFANITIRRGATIANAFIALSAYPGTGCGVLHGFLHAEDSDNSLPFNQGSPISDRPLTGAGEDWNWSAGDCWEGSFQSPDISAAVQEVINREGWKMGNAISVFYSPADTPPAFFRRCYSYDGDPDLAPVLVVFYTLHGCCEAGEAGCDDDQIEACVCAQYPSCCEQEWDEFCTARVPALGCGCCSETDCNANGVPDDCDIVQCASSPECGDCDSNGTPDKCEYGTIDCDGSGLSDECEIVMGLVEDCNANGVPDECDVEVATNADDADLILAGDVPGDWFGIAVDEVGDVNGDGVSDFVVGASADLTTPGPGCVQVFSGVDGAPLWQQAQCGVSDGDEFGSSVSGIADVTGDGVPDVIAGAHVWNDRAGMARLLSGADGELVWTWEGEDETGWFGFGVSDAGDIDQDGVNDVVVGAPLTESQAGRVTVFSGSDFQELATFTGDDQCRQLGLSVAGAGDLNGDSFPDILVGAPAYTDIPGCARIYSGKFIAANEGPEVLYTLLGQSDSDVFGASVAGAGDVNDDGYPDVVVGAYKDDNNGNNAGRATLFSGAHMTNGTGSLVLYTWLGESAGDNFGWVDAGDDLDSDGFTDILVGGTQYDNNGTGYARLFSGKTGDMLLELSGEENGDRFGRAVTSIGGLSAGDDVAVIVGAYWASSQAGRVYVFRLLSSADCNANDVPDECEALNDFEFDCDVDLIDFGSFQACFTGGGPATLGDGCSVFDQEPDEDVDLDDFAAFQEAAGGPLP